MKVITICGSLKFKDEMMKIAINLALKGNCVITPIYPVDDYKSKYTKEEIENLHKIHKKKLGYLMQYLLLMLMDILEVAQKMRYFIQNL